MLALWRADCGQLAYFATGADMAAASRLFHRQGCAIMGAKRVWVSHAFVQGQAPWAAVGLENWRTRDSRRRVWAARKCTFDGKKLVLTAVDFGARPRLLPRGTAIVATVLCCGCAPLMVTDVSTWSLLGGAVLAAVGCTLGGCVRGLFGSCWVLSVMVMLWVLKCWDGSCVAS